MREISELKEELGIALNEAALLGVEVDPDTLRAGLTFSVLTLPESGPSPEDSRVQMILEGVGRVAASLRTGHCTEPQGEPLPFELEELLGVVQEFGGCPIYGWEFFDCGDAQFRRWRDHLSLDWQAGTQGGAHTLDVFQEGGGRCLEIRLWFERLELYSSDRTRLSVAEFVAGGKRWWDAFNEDDPRTLGRGPVRLKG